MKKIIAVVSLLLLLLLVGVGVYCYKNVYTLWMPIGEATMVSYNHQFCDDSCTCIYCPTHSAVEATMSGSLVCLSNEDGFWQIVLFNHRTGLTSIYSRLDTVCVTTKVSQGDTIGYTGKSRYLQYQLLRINGSDTLHINPAPKFDENFL